MISICRLCCTHYDCLEMENLFNVKNQRLLDKLKYCACFTFRVDVNDGFPPYICNRCTKLLHAAYEFKMICESAEANFWALSEPNDIDTMQMEGKKYQIELVDYKRDFTFKDLEIDIDSDAMETTSPTDDRISKMLCTDETVEDTMDKFDVIIHHTNGSGTNRSKIPRHTEKRKISTKATGSTCDICGETYSRKRDLERHLKFVHHPRQKAVRIKSWICESCGKNFRSKYALKHHINGSHVDVVEKNYSCDPCDFKCRLARYLVAHALTHTGIKSHRCDECGLAFGVQGSLNRHKRAVHRNERPHKCVICDRYFKTTVQLREHWSFHSGHPHECPQCPKTYRYKNNLARHMRQCHRSAKNSSQRLPFGLGGN